ncbi:MULTISPECIES: 2-(hydroxymethyl)glutarate dehydrogenase [Eubacterium]|uniref:2-(hydroxymethyl)glutarate dehydrogenase n=2 Tax=Eubacterium barkeri TaxID=1528 RepID=HMGD_EUBBA|nr:2-(hydroxymethyl)glutarate dehydrogenase [Eubacterium barkeri]Q0QLF5.1 RecName: Full=2-(hydroxymethyl)glutarate dehydrogenase [Eubacterium barkeri]3CKY_A Chain A, 2-hydroxymethyl glutarate dehydrogenase [Eubacterium barkeri]3CKY_B Chain B, 2-hydroxymethyl glutarate dehydrogenase [Eubacterium barkeri]3CKY_C Chain C, 2-hydroxymethyl glutarate dehydrogenase [Eubacterium barkeri]3CKY_D Chain D, 2-hydroxymethyl glutarate dehydrogenase [Eubacterium barkeri]ABC88394.1 2-hydroxymethyl glutarate de
MEKSIKIGFIGLGAMGKPMAINLLKEGVTVYAFDLMEANVAAVVAQGAQACENNQKVAAASDIIFTSLPNAGIVETVMNGPGGVLSACKAGTVIVDMSSVSPSSTLKMAKVAAEKGIDYVDAPVSGGTKGAEAGTLTIMVGASEAVFEKIQPVLSVIGKDIYHVGDTGAGDAVKIVNNLLLGCNMASLAEALVLGVKCGLKPETMQEIIGKSSGRSYAMEAKMEKFIMSGDFAGGFAMDLQHKDLGLALEAGKEGNVPLPMTAMATQIFEGGRAMGLGREDMSAVIKVWEQMTGVSVSGGQ